MKNYSLPTLLILLSILAGIMTYFTSKYFIKFYAVLLPVELLFLCLLFVFGKSLRAQVKPIAGFTLLTFSMLIALSVLFFLYIYFPLPDMPKEWRFSSLVLRYFGIIGMSAICGFVLQLLIYSRHRAETAS